LITDVILAEYNKNSDRQFLILSDRTVHLKELNKIFKEKGMTSTGIILSGTTREGLIKFEKCKIILATYAMANEGLDIPSLNCLVLASPKIQVEQAIGRISRLNNYTFKPLVIDFIDTMLTFIIESRKRMKYYLMRKYAITDYVYNEDEETFINNPNIHKDYSIYMNNTKNSKIDTEYKDINVYTNKKSDDSNDFNNFKKTNIVRVDKVSKKSNMSKINKKNDVDKLFDAFDSFN
jgi:hypothetical protein